MDDGVLELVFRPRPTADRPLLGMTVLVVEDSRYASEAMRLLCLRSGARIRRADCIASAERHLNVYRPTVAIVDLGLPDGSGLDLIRRMHGLTPRVSILLGTSGAEREAAEARSLAAGADGFLPKPISSLAVFQAEIQRHMPEEMRPRSLRAVDPSHVAPDVITYREDLSRAVELLGRDQPPVGYLRRFLLGLARSAQDPTLETRARDFDQTAGQAERIDLQAFLSRKIETLPKAI